MVASDTGIGMACGFTNGHGTAIQRDDDEGVLLNKNDRELLGR